MLLNSNWIKNYDAKHKNFHFWYFLILYDLCEIEKKLKWKIVFYVVPFDPIKI